MTAQSDTLVISLAACVPLRIWEMRRWTEEARTAAAHRSAAVVAQHGDDLQFGGRHCREAWAALVTGLAAGAYQPGGVTWAGQHWCTDHAACKAAERAAAGVDGAP